MITQLFSLKWLFGKYTGRKAAIVDNPPTYEVQILPRSGRVNQIPWRALKVPSYVPQNVSLTISGKVDRVWRPSSKHLSPSNLTKSNIG